MIKDTLYNQDTLACNGHCISIIRTLSLRLKWKIVLSKIVLSPHTLPSMQLGWSPAETVNMLANSLVVNGVLIRPRCFRHYN